MRLASTKLPECANDEGALPRYEPKTARQIVIVSSPLFYEGLTSMLDGVQANIVGSFTAVSDALAAFAGDEAPDLVIVVAHSSEAADAAIAEMRNARARLIGTRWLLLGTDMSPARVRQAIAAGVEGILLHDISAAVLRCSVELVLLGQFILPNSVTEGFASQAAGFAAPADQPGRPLAQAQDGAAMRPAGIRAPSRLSDRERQILECLMKGHSNKLIARQLEIADATVKVHVKALLRKMQVANRTQAAINASTYLQPVPVIELAAAEPRGVRPAPEAALDIPVAIAS